jgi:hypothetical protein
MPIETVPSSFDSCSVSSFENNQMKSEESSYSRIIHSNFEAGQDYMPSEPVRVAGTKPWFSQDWRRRWDMDDGRQRFLHYTAHQPQFEPQTFPQSDRPCVVLPPPSSLIPPHEPLLNRHHIMAADPPSTEHDYALYSDQRGNKDTKFEKVNKRKRNRPLPSISTPGYHYEVLNMTKRKRSKRDASAAETLASFGRLPRSPPSHNDMITEGYSGDEYEYRGRNRGDSSCHDSQTLMIEVKLSLVHVHPNLDLPKNPFCFRSNSQAARILCALSTRR